LDPEKEVIALIGSKEGIANITRAFINQGDGVLVPNPAYPVYANGGTILSDGIPIEMPLLEENGFKPDLAKIGSFMKTRQNVKMMFLNYPNNPTAAVVNLSSLREMVDFALEQNIVICYDNAYSEITFDGYCAPSIFEIDGEKFATYVADFAGGVRTETSGVVILEDGKYVIDFDNLEKKPDPWLFWQTSNKNLNDVAVLLTSSFEGRVWYEKDGNTLTIYGDKSDEVSYRLSAPRIDHEKWDNLADNQSLAGINVANY